MGKKGQVIILCLLFLFSCKSQKVTVDAQSAQDYLLKLQKPNGGFGPEGFEYTDVAWTYPAAHALNLLNVNIPKADSAYINGHKSWIEKAPWRNGPWYWSLQQKANLYQLYSKNGDLEPGMTEKMELELRFDPRENYTEFRDYVDGKFHDIPSLWNLIDAIKILEGEIKNRDFIEEFVLKRKTDAGGFESLLGDRETPHSEKAHVIVTHDAVMIMNSLDIAIPDKEKIISWIQSLQTSEGGFRWNPKSESRSNKADVWYTWAAVKTLDVLGARPERVKDCMLWLNSLQNADGGFGDRPGWQSRIYSTYYAIHSMDILTENAEQGITEKSIEINNHDVIPEGEFSIFQAHHKSPEGGSEMVDIVADMGLNLIAVKTTEESLYASNGMSKSIQEAREYAAAQNYPLEVVEEPENYRHRLKWFSGLYGNHVSNYMIPPDITGDQWNTIKTAYEAGIKRLPWEEYKKEVIEPILAMGNLYYPELDYTRLNAYIVYDEGLNGGVGYNAVPAAHFGNYDWVRHFPYKERWLGQLPMIADGDAHGDIHEWKENLESYRNIFIAKDYTYASYIEASQNQRSVCVIKMPSGEIRYYGSQAAIAYLKNHKQDWQWWK